MWRKAGGRSRSAGACYDPSRSVSDPGSVAAVRGDSRVLVERTQFGIYTVVDKIGQGAMGEVFKAHDPDLDRHVALKTIVSSLESSSEARKRFHVEAKSIARLNHPNIVTVYDFGEENGVVYMAMELLDGSDLRTLINSNKVEGLGAKLAVMEQVCDGVGYAHSQSVVHRDLKPANIQVLSTGHVKVMDFGLARIGAASGMTATGAVLGTPHYMSPEQVRGQKADARSDVFALGAILYQLLTGRQPFDAESVHAVLFKILESEPDPVERWIPDIPTAVVGLAVRALAKDPKARFGDGAEMAATVSGVRSAFPGGKSSSDLSNLATLLAGEEQGATRILPTRSQGNLALEALVDSGVAGAAKTHEEVSTLSGKAPTRPGAGRRSASGEVAAGSGRRWVQAAVAAVGVVGAVGLVAWGVLRPGLEQASVASQQSGLGAVEQQLLVAERQLAQQSLQDGRYQEAIAHAERALGVAADDTESLRVREAAVAELTTQLNVSLRPKAEEARTAMRRSETEARRRGASGEAVAHASTLLREGEAAFSSGEYAVAAERFVTARDAFARAGRAAATRATAETKAGGSAAARTAAANAQAARARAAEEEAARVKAAQEAAAGAKVAQEAAARARVPPPPPAPAPVVAPPAPARVTPSSATASAPPPAPAAGPSDEELIESLIADYERAIETQDLGLFRRVKPNLSDDEESVLRRSFQAGRATIDIEILALSVSDDKKMAQGRLVRRDSINGDFLPPFEQLLSLRKGPGGWGVETIGR